jgi:hypothetical protein
VKPFLQFFLENYSTTPKIRDIEDEITGEKIGEEKYENYHINLPDGARSFGTIRGNVASITQINAPKSSDKFTPIRGTQTYQRILKILHDNGVDTVEIYPQSADSIAAISKIINSGILKNPRKLRGLSVAQYPTVFDISINS